MAAMLSPTRDGRAGPDSDLCYAGFWRRMAADLVDNIVLLPVVSALAPVRWPAHPTLASLAQAMAADPMRQFFGVIFGIAYSVVFWVKFLARRASFCCPVISWTRKPSVRLRSASRCCATLVI